MQKIELPDPTKDKVDHIRIDLNAVTRMGRKLPFLADVKVTHPKYGIFRTGEGLLQYLTTGKDLEELKVASGFEAKKIGARHQNKWSKTLREDLKIALRSKIEDNLEIYVEFVESTLPFRYYHMLRNKRVIEPKEMLWVSEWLGELREEFQKEIQKTK